VPGRTRETGVGERELRGSGAVDQDVLVARSLLGLGHRGPDVGHIGDRRPLPHFAVGLAAAEDEDRHPVVVVAALAARRLEGRPAGDDRPGGHHLVEDLAVDAHQTTGDLVGVGTSPARISRPASRRVDHSDGAGREGFRAAQRQRSAFDHIGEH
jgi:hypothetical protein